MNTIFRKENLEDVNYDLFEMAAYAAMAAGYESIGFGGFAAGEEVLLYGNQTDWNRRSVVSLTNWFGYLTLLVTDRKGMFLMYSHIDGLPAAQAIIVLYNQFLSVKDKIDTDAEQAFPRQEVRSETLTDFQKRLSEIEKRIHEYTAEHPETKED